MCVYGRDGDTDQMSFRTTKADLTSDHVLVIFGEHPDLLYDTRVKLLVVWPVVCGFIWRIKTSV